MLFLKSLHQHLFGATNENHENPNHDIPYSGRDSNRVPPECEARVLTTN
jgi:hypothetical protein